ncbi:COX15/CtaA family protein [Phaeovulum veldkampii]|nr:COX15/CtaA family protein [Phaeovulum veldkampii]TDQ60367.1 cytochrome c oxidase assembly protein subunit 15 [Phaeovulum veldkampii DSM 11550]
MAKKRSIFEEVATPQAPVPQGGMIDARPQRGARGPIRVWLALVSVLVLAALMAAAWLRLSDADLAAALWQAPLSLVPPMDAAGWVAALAAVQPPPAVPALMLLTPPGGASPLAAPEAGLTLAAFQPLYWAHWGQMVAVLAAVLVWLLGWLGFALMRRFPAGMAGAQGLVGLVLIAAAALSLGGSAGVLADQALVQTARLVQLAGLDPAALPQAPLWPGRAAVLAQLAPWRAALAAALGFAALGMLLWPWLKLARSDVALLQARRLGEPRLLALATGMMFFAFAQILLGGLLAGIDAGRGFADWPMMAGKVLPVEVLAALRWPEALRDPALVQFAHRGAGYLLVVLGLVAVWRSRRSPHPVTRGAFTALALVLVLQSALGVLAVLRGSPAELGLAHLAGAVVLWGVILRARLFARYPVVQSIRGGKQ